jgi:hypothetical protein
MAAKQKNPAAVALRRKGGKVGGPARAARLTPEQRSSNARKAVLARWAKSGNGSSGEARRSAPASSRLSTSKQALHLCLKRLKNAKDEGDIRRLTDELQRIVFHKQYRNAED